MSAADPKKPSNTVAVRLLSLGAVAALLGAGLYAFFAFDSNQDGEQVAGCSIDETHRAALDKAATGEVAAFRATDRPYSVTDMGFQTADGTPVTMANWEGKAVLFNLWATWCAPCRKEMPALDALQNELGGDTFEVVPVSVDIGSADKPKSFYQETGLQHLGFFHDPKLATLNTLKKGGFAYGLPATILVDQKGCVTGVLNGPAEWHSDDAKKLIRVELARG